MTSTVAQALALARARGLERLDAQLLLAHAMQRDRSWVIAHDDQTLDADEQRRWLHLMERSSQGEPLAYLRGMREFHGLPLHVTPQVLIPRPETELLVGWAIECIDAAGRPPDPAPPRLADLGTGSGAIALALKRARSHCDIVATDFSSDALAIARANAAALQLPVRCLLGDWFDALPRERFDIIVANPPYVADDDPHLADLRYEPRSALTAGADGLDAIRKLVAGAEVHLNEHGWLLLEHGWDQAERVQELMHSHGYADVSTRADLSGQPRCTGGRTGLRSGR